MFPGETIRSGASPVCCEGTRLPLRVLRSGAGYYIGTQCPMCGPYSRESEYYPTQELAEKAMATETVRWRT